VELPSHCLHGTNGGESVGRPRPLLLARPAGTGQPVRPRGRAIRASSREGAGDRPVPAPADARYEALLCRPGRLSSPARQVRAGAGPPGCREEGGSV